MQDQPTQEQTTTPSPAPAPAITPVFEPAPQPAQEPTPSTYPGKTMSIVGLIFAFVGLQIIGLILSIVARNKGKQAGIKNGIAFAGIIANSVMIGLGLIFIPILISLTLVSYNGVSTKANDNLSKISATATVKAAEAYSLSNDAYPTTSSQLDASTVAGITYSDTAITTQPSAPSVVAFYSCDDGGNRVEYWNYTSAAPVSIYTGASSTLSNCTVSK